jgi:predicted dehydrogenase
VTIRNVALVGAGQMGANHARTIHRSEEFQLAFVVDADLERAKGLVQQFGGQAVASVDDIKDVQAAVVATSTNSHFGIVENLLGLKIPVLCEKPLTPSLETTRVLIETSEKNATPIQCGFVERFNPAFLTAKKMIGQPVIHAQSVRHSPPALRIASGVAEDLLIHDLDLALSLSTAPVMSVAGSVYRSSTTGEDEISDCIINLEDNAVFTLSASRMSQRKIRDWRICTDKDLFEVDLLRQTVTIYENITQEFLNQGNATYRARTMVDYPFIERSGEPLAMQLQHFSRLLDGAVREQSERDSILASHIALSDFLEASGH